MQYNGKRLHWEELYWKFQLQTAVQCELWGDLCWRPMGGGTHEQGGEGWWNGLAASEQNREEDWRNERKQWKKGRRVGQEEIHRNDLRVYKIQEKQCSTFQIQFIVDIWWVGNHFPNDSDISGEELRSTLELVQIHFDTATFDKIERDKKIKTEAQLSLIGGTMGLLTSSSFSTGQTAHLTM